MLISFLCSIYSNTPSTILLSFNRSHVNSYTFDSAPTSHFLTVVIKRSVRARLWPFARREVRYQRNERYMMPVAKSGR